MQTVQADTAMTALKISLSQLIPEIIRKHMTEDQRKSTEETPKRFLKALLEMTNGYILDPAEILARRFPQSFDEMIVVNDIEFTSMCEHHLLPIIGKATVGYIPNGEVVGLSKIPRLVDCFAHRFQLQERLTKEIADALEQHLKPVGVGVIIEASHQCMSCRGVRKQNPKMITSDMRGAIRNDSKARAEFLKFRER